MWFSRNRGNKFLAGEKSRHFPFHAASAHPNLSSVLAYRCSRSPTHAVPTLAPPVSIMSSTFLFTCKSPSAFLLDAPADPPALSTAESVGEGHPGAFFVPFPSRSAPRQIIGKLPLFSVVPSADSTA